MAITVNEALLAATVLWDEVPDRQTFPYTLPAIEKLDRLDLDSPVVYFVGENGSGKSTVLEAIALAAEINPGGGSRNLTPSGIRTESALHEYLRLTWRIKHAWGFFLRAESFFNTITAYGGGLHGRSHGEQFVAAIQKWIVEKGAGIFLLDEPEAALSMVGQLKVLRQIHEAVPTGGQFIIATHSPVILAYPGALIYEFTDEGIRRIAYEETQPYRLMKSFLDDPDRFLHYLFVDDDEPL